jgi:DNA (cytosine-5)-methyltransferase 1
MYVLDLFSGIGGFSLGLERAGMKTVAFCEIDPHCRKVLAKHWPGIKIHDDIKQLDGSQYVGAVDVICGGYPCQPFSTAGQQRGEADPRHLWPEMRRIIQQARPRWVIAENVVGHITNGLDDVLDEMENLDYATWPFLIPSRAVGSEIKRQRLWIMGRCRNWSHRTFHSISTCDQSSAQQESSGHSQEQPSTLGLCAASNRESEGQDKPPVCGISIGLPDQLERERAIGNSVDARIVERIGRVILAYERQIRMAA